MTGRGEVLTPQQPCWLSGRGTCARPRSRWARRAASSSFLNIRIDPVGSRS